jgi:hypothetical protein
MGHEEVIFAVLLMRFRPHLENSCATAAIIKNKCQLASRPSFISGLQPDFFVWISGRPPALESSEVERDRLPELAERSVAIAKTDDVMPSPQVKASVARSSTRLSDW